jgi:hypothetical protein
VVLVVYPGHTHADSMKVMLEQMARVGANVLGVVFNRIPRSRSYYYGGYRHYKGYYYSSYKGYSAYYYGEDGTRHRKLRSNHGNGNNGHIPQGDSVENREETPPTKIEHRKN